VFVCALSVVVSSGVSVCQEWEKKDWNFVSVIEKKREYYYECETLLRVLYIYGSQFLSKFQKGVRAFVQNLYPNINYI
jgi:hypothetical protein